MALAPQNWLLFLSDYGIALVLFGAFFEGETVIILAGVLCHQSVLPFMWTVCAAAVGAFSGDQLGFHIGRRYGPKALARFQRVAVQAERIRPLLKARSDWIAFGCRFVYGTRIVAPMLLGAHGYPPGRFALINLFSAALWALAGVSAGYLIGTGAEKLLGRIAHLEQLLLAVLLVMVGWWWYRHRKSHKDSFSRK
jgi:membrane protein DedA with SNARE-associated domain